MLPKQDNLRSLRTFRSADQVSTLLAALLATAVVACIRTSLAVVLGRIFDPIVAFGDGKYESGSLLSEVSQWCIILMGMGFANWISNTAFMVFWTANGELFARNARLRLLSTLLAQDIAWFDGLEEGTSSLLVRTETRLREFQLGNSQVAGLLLCDLLTGLASLGIAFYHSWRLTLVLLSTLPLSALVLSLTSKPLLPSIEAQQGSQAVAAKHVTALLQAIDLVKAFGGYIDSLKKYQRASAKSAKAHLIQARCTSLQLGYVAFWVVGTFVMGFWYGIVLVQHGAQPGEILTTFYATLAVLQSLEALMPQWLVIVKGISAAAYLAELTTISCWKTSARGNLDFGLRPGHCVGAVELKNVSFVYPAQLDTPALKTSSLFFPAGETTFIVGRSGSGKSTIGNLVANYYEPTTGEVLLDGLPFGSLDPQWIQSQITLIQQSSVVFNETLFTNVAFGHPKPKVVTHRQVMAACELALLRKMIDDLPHGLNTLIGRWGHCLSGGQAQRLALSRGALRDPKVLILDEVTMGLDQLNRSLLTEAIRSWRKDKTTIIITHDLSQVGQNDYVYVMNDSSLLQQGFRRDLEKAPDGPFSAPTLFSTGKKHQPCTTILSPSSCTQEPSFKSSRDRTVVPSFPANVQNAPPRVRSLWPDLEELLLANSGSGSFGQIDRHEERTKAARWHIKNHERGLVLATDEETVEASWLSSWRADINLPHRTNGSSFFEPLDTSKHILRQGSAVSGSPFIFGNADRRANIQQLRQRRPEPNRKSEKFECNDKRLFSQQRSLFSILRTVWPTLMFPGKLATFFGLVACVVAIIITPMFSYCFAQLLTAMWTPGDKLGEGKKWALYLLGIAICDGLSMAASRYLLEYAGQCWVDRIRLNVVELVVQQPASWFRHRKHAPCQVTEVLDRNGEEMRELVGRFLPLVVIASGMIAVSILWSLTISWRLTLVALSPVPAFLGVIKAYTSVSSKWESRCNDSASACSATLSEPLLALRVVRTFELESHFSDKVRKAVANSLAKGLRRAIYSSPLFGLYQSVNYAITALVFYYGTSLLADEEANISVTDVLKVVNLLLFGVGTAAGFLGSIPQLTQAQTAASELLAWTNLPNDRKDSYAEITSPLPVRCERLSFSYEPGDSTKVLHDVSLKINAGQCTVIAGPSGCGKTTLGRILLSLEVPSPRDPDRPSPLRYGQTATTELNIHGLRLQCGYAPQSSFLFPMTIYDNIVYGLPKDSLYREHEQVVGAAWSVGLHDFISSLPEGYQTLIGEGGQALSGGQAQRLGIARASVRRPKLLVLDEPTSSVDGETAKFIYRLIKNSAAASDDGMAIVVITHDVEILRLAGSIILLEDGRKVAQGTYDDLSLTSRLFIQLLNQ